MSPARALRTRATLRFSGRSKYGAVPTLVDGVKFASKAEARRYVELKLLEKAGVISGLTLQPRFALVVQAADGTPRTIGSYVADFAYSAGSRSGATGQAGVEDVKGHATPLYKWKKKHVEAQYGITIREIRRR